MNLILGFVEQTSIRVDNNVKLNINAKKPLKRDVEQFN